MVANAMVFTGPRAVPCAWRYSTGPPTKGRLSGQGGAFSIVQLIDSIVADTVCMHSVGSRLPAPPFGKYPVVENSTWTCGPDSPIPVVSAKPIGCPPLTVSPFITDAL